MPSNTAAWQSAIGAKLEVKPAPYTPPSENEVVIKNGAVAINPVDWILQDRPMFPWLQYPAILGHDVAGEVAEVGSAVSRFQIGDRVVGHAVGTATNKASEGAFQEYSLVLAHMASHIPSSLSYDNAAVLPLGFSTAACGLFQKDHLALQHPSVPAAKSTGKTLLVWGGSTSVGSNGIQLAVAAGYEVITTASPKNFDYVKKLGASQVFDYNSKTVIDDLVNAFENKTIAGALDTAGINGAAEACLDVVDKSHGDKSVSVIMFIPENKPSGVNVTLIFGATLKDNEVSKAVYVDFLAQALAEGTYIAAPDPWVVGKGLESVQAGFDAQKKGVSAKKVVVTL